MKLRHALSKSTPNNIQELLSQLSQGALFVLEANTQTKALVSLVRDCIAEVAGPEVVSRALSTGRCPPLPYEEVKLIREEVYQRPELWGISRDILLSFGVPLETRLDTPRLRVITHGDEQKPEAAAVYVMHRDTWYGCPQDQLNWWMPIFPTPKAQAFGFFPSYFERPVPNRSDAFEYERWMQEVGWHGATEVEKYPQPEDVVSKDEMVRFDFEAGDVLVFSAHHLHQTQPNPIPESARWSLDFRSTNHASAAPNVDNRSKGAEARVQKEFRALSSSGAR